MTKEEEKRAVEVLITTALMNVLSEQSEMVKEVYKYKTKQDFNTLIRLLDKMLIIPPPSSSAELVVKMQLVSSGLLELLNIPAPKPAELPSSLTPARVGLLERL